MLRLSRTTPGKRIGIAHAGPCSKLRLMIPKRLSSVFLVQLFGNVLTGWVNNPNLLAKIAQVPG